ncbi:hypothetical protein J2P12_00085 [Candidatus Bathyarchaeota archaeon]|nr:hypothetical protein [Candidatus Bathyarchaeota archaeon]
MPEQKQKENNPTKGKVEVWDLSVPREVKVPEVEDALKAAKLAIDQAVAQKAARTHRCRVCHDPGCEHFQREYDDTKEEFDDESLPDLDGVR